MRKTVAITTGDPAGVGPEVVRKCLSSYSLPKGTAFVIYGDKFLPPGFSYIRSEMSLDGSERDKKKIMLIGSPDKMSDKCQLFGIIIPAPGVVPGKPDSNGGKSAYRILERVTADIKDYQFDALVTAPVSKKAIREFDPAFIGHTEYLAAKFSCETFVMNFVSEKLNVALLTTHVSLQKVSEQITEELIIPKLRLIYRFALQRNPKAKIALLGMNPHCGEEGAFGREEDILTSSLAELRQEGIDIDGPFPADSFFRYKVFEYQQVIACYHDQGLIPFKMLAGEKGVNVTLGLPFFRASVDHGTAYDIAGKGIASTKSMESALNVTLKIIEA